MIPHGFCLEWRTPLLLLHLLSDFLIVVSYYAIPSMLYLLVRRHTIGTVIGRPVFYLFMVFIFACGTTHLMDMIVLWYPVYFLQGIIKAATGFCSFLTALVLASRIPPPPSDGTPLAKLKEIVNGQ